ncbi:TPA: hypothetical protein ACHICQ_001986 [Enterobacter roggenkampii]|nr:hypothetical protein [Enterobacter roggenkampii]
MKANLLNALEMLKDEETLIVKRKALFDIKPGDKVFIDGDFLIWVRGRFERKLSHISYRFPDNETVYHAVKRGLYFIVMT